MHLTAKLTAKRSGSLLKRFIQLRHGVLLHGGHHMRVDVHRHADLSMAQHLLDDFGVDAEAKK